MKSLLLNKIILCVIFLLLFTQESKSQIPIAGFTSDATTGCAPSTIKFTDQSTGNPDTWKWDFGNSNTSSLQNPSATYLNPGTYTVSLTSSNANGSNTITKTSYITIYKPPDSEFKTDIFAGCIPLTVNLADLTSQGTGTLSVWDWDFGDGTRSNLQNPQHTFTAAGKYKVTLQVYDDKNCWDTTIKKNYIRVGSPPTINFFASPPAACAPPLNTTFFDKSISTTGTITSWLWDFGDNTTSTLKNPSHNYPNYGRFTVSLKVTDELGCSNTLVKNDYIVIEDFKANFTLDSLNMCNKMKITVRDTSSPNPVIWQWKFGNLGGGNGQILTYFFTNSGKYDIRLIATNNGGCIDTAIKTFTYLKPVAKFTLDTTYACSVPFTVNFTNQSTGVNPLSYLWYFGSYEDSAFIRDPIHIFKKEGVYPAKLIVTDALGCKDSLLFLNAIEVNLPDANFRTDKSSGCIALDVIFTDKSLSKEPIVSWQWNFDDPVSGTNNTSTDTNTTHTFDSVGVYGVTLTITNSLGCKASYSKDISAGIKPDTVNFFMLDPQTLLPVTSICYLDTVLFVDSSYFFTPKYTVNDWNWNMYYNDTIGITPLVNCSPYNQFTFNTPNVTFPFKHGIGAIMDTILHIALFNGCPDSVTKILEIKGPVTIPSYSELGFCSFPDTISVSDSLSNEIIDFTTVFLGWKLKDFDKKDSVISMQNDVSFPLSHSGMYLIELGFTNITNGCTAITKDTIKVDSMLAKFRIKSPFYQCLDNNLFVFRDTSYTRFGTKTNWEWIFGDGDTLMNKITSGTDSIRSNDNDSGRTDGIYQHPAHIYKDTGTYVIKLNVFANLKNSLCIPPIIKQCTQTFSDTVSVHHVYPKFVSRDLSGVVDTSDCAPFTLTLMDTGKVTSQAKYRIWDFGDQTFIDTILYDTATVKHTFLKGDYTVKLTLIDTMGCKATLSKYQYIEATFPVSQFTDDNPVCISDTVSFNNNSNGVLLKYLWKFGDGDSSTVENPIHKYSQPGIYNVTLLSIDKNNCDSMTSPSKVRIVDLPKIDIGLDRMAADCAPRIVKFTDKTVTVFGNNTYYWTFGDSSFSTTKNPSHKYSDPGYYDVTLKVIDSIGCRDSIKKDSLVIALGPSGEVRFGPNTGCTPLPVSFKAYNLKSTTSLIWDFGDGNIAKTDSVIHTYFLTQGDTSNVMHPNLTLELEYDTLKCKKAIAIDSIYISIPYADFIMDPNVTGFESPNVTFINLSQNAKLNDWDFGDPTSLGNNKSGEINPSHIYSESGKFNVLLTVTNRFGCVDTCLKRIEAYTHIKPSNFMTPNGDGVNDFFVIKGLNFGAHLYIFNRWGVKVYDNGDYRNDWNGVGMNGDFLPDGVYYFVVLDNTTNENEKGWILLMKNK